MIDKNTDRNANHYYVLVWDTISIETRATQYNANSVRLKRKLIKIKINKYWTE